MTGTLYLVATPLGNLEDITLRALRILGEVDLIACEDTRHSRKLLTHYNIHKPLISYHEHNERDRSAELIEALRAGKSVALISDAGTPAVSDPGYHLVRQALAAGIVVVPLPGPVAVITALVASGLPTMEFHFVGFLPVKSSARRARLTELSEIKATLIFYEAPHRLGAMLTDLLAVLGNRQAVLARELTKIHEEFQRGLLTDLIDRVSAGSVRGEFVVLVEGQTNTVTQYEGTMTEQVHELIEQAGLSKKEAIKQVAKLRGLSKSEVYRAVIEAEELGDDPGSA